MWQNKINAFTESRMDKDKLYDLKISLPLSGCAKSNKATSATTIRREPNLKLQHRVATPTQTNPKDIWKVRPATPSTLKNFIQPSSETSETSTGVLDEISPLAVENTGRSNKQKLRSKLSLDLDERRDPFTVPRGRSKSENNNNNTYIRREPNHKLMNRESTPMSEETSTSAFLHSPSVLRTVNISPLARQLHNQHQTKYQLEEKLPTEETIHRKKKLHKSLTVSIPSPCEVENSGDEEAPKCKAPLRRSCSDKYIRREKNLKVMYRVPTPITSTGKNMLDLRPSTPCTIPTTQVGDYDKEINNNKDTASLDSEDETITNSEVNNKSPRSRKTDKKLTVDITKLYEEGKPNPHFIRRETNLKVLHRQDTPVLRNYIDHCTDTFNYLDNQVSTS